MGIQPEARAKLWNMPLAWAKWRESWPSWMRCPPPSRIMTSGRPRVMAICSARWVLALPSLPMLPPCTEKSCEKSTTGRPSIDAVPTTTPSDGLGSVIVLFGRHQRAHLAERAVVDQPGQPLAGAQPPAGMDALDGGGTGLVQQTRTRGLDRGDQVLDAGRRRDGHVARGGSALIHRSAVWLGVRHAH